MIKISLNAAAKREVAKKFGLIFEGTGRNWALRNLRKGKSWEDIGSLSKRHLKYIEPQVKKYSKKGREIAIDIYGKRRGKLRVGGIGVAPAVKSDKITKRLHTHPYEGLLKQKYDDILTSYYEAKGLRDKSLIKSFISQSKKLGGVKQFKENKKIKAKLTGTQRAHPNPFGKTDIRSDIDTMKLMPKANHNILNPDHKVLGIHKLRRGGLREVYRQL